MPLTAMAVQNAKPRENSYALTDGNSLHLLVKPNGSKLWRFRYRFAGKPNMLGLGSFPEISLADARTQRDARRKLLANGLDPSRQKKLDKITAKSAANNTFGAIAEEHLKNQEEGGTAASTMAKNRWYLQVLAAPLANLPITEITPAEILSLLKKIEKSGRRETARKVRGAIGSVFRLAITTLRATNDPTFPLRRALLKPNVQHRPLYPRKRTRLGVHSVSALGQKQTYALQQRVADPNRRGLDRPDIGPARIAASMRISPIHRAPPCHSRCAANLSTGE